MLNNYNEHLDLLSSLHGLLQRRVSRARRKYTSAKRKQPNDNDVTGIFPCRLHWWVTLRNVLHNIVAKPSTSRLGEKVAWVTFFQKTLVTHFRIVLMCGSKCFTDRWYSRWRIPKSRPALDKVGFLVHCGNLSASLFLVQWVIVILLIDSFIHVRITLLLSFRQFRTMIGFRSIPLEKKAPSMF